MGSIGWVAIGVDGAIACLIICRWTRCHRRSPHSIFTQVRSNRLFWPQPLGEAAVWGGICRCCWSQRERSMK